jgi:hypothetical protein
MQAVGRNTFETIKRAALPALAILIIANFLGYAIMGANGILSWGDYRRQKAERLVQLADLNAEKLRLAHRSACSTRSAPTPIWSRRRSSASSAWSAPTRSSSRSTDFVIPDLIRDP